MKIERPEMPVFGQGDMGSAVVYQLAKKGVRLVGTDQFIRHTLTVLPTAKRAPIVARC